MNEKQLLDALQHLQVETGSLACLGCGHEHNCSLQGCNILRKAVAAIREKQEQKWIPVTERMPDLIPCNAGTEYSEAVMILTSERKVVEAIWNGTFWIAPFEFWDSQEEKVTHWMPLPPIPTDTTVKENCSECIHHDIFWGGSGCNLLNNVEQCKFTPRKSPQLPEEPTHEKE